MRATLMQRTVVLFGLVALAATCVRAQGSPFEGVNNWGYGSGSNNPYNSNPNSNDSGNNNNSDDSGNSGSGSSGSGSGSGSSGANGDSSGSDTGGAGDDDSGSGNGNSVNPGGSVFGGGSGTTAGNGNGGFPSGFGSGLGFSSTNLDISEIMSLPVAHGALAATAFGFLFPLGAILMRVMPGRDALVAHGFVQVLAYAVYIAGAGLGLYLVSVIRVGQEDGLLDVARTNAHPIIGIVLVVALFFQPILGAVHHRRFKRLGRRTWVSHAHLWTGRLGITLGIVNGGLGLALAGTRGAPVVAYAVVSGIMWFLWVLTALRAEYRRSKTQRTSEKIVQDDREFVPAVRGGGGGGSPDSTRLPSVDNPLPPGASMDVPSPPYTPGPHYAAHMAHVNRQPVGAEMPNLKEVMDGSDTVPILSASQDEMRRGQV
ncbi:hypothetical protein F5Y12DRAFT_271084 [Xylaria sp. FL1777]|nr:hypothetical protein F5Y12DRAFT_271084 [Xylaria sp. FL1777]